MRFLRAIGIGALFWLIIFVEISITMIGLAFSDLTTYIIHYILMIPLSILCAWLYYKSGDKTNGFALGLLVVLVGVVLDMIITIPLFIIPQGGSYGSYFSNYYLLAGLLEGIVLIGLYKNFKR